MLKWFGAFTDRLFAVAGALIFLQAPQFMQQYMSRISGHINELKIHIHTIRLAAEKSGKGIAEYVGKFAQSTDLDIASQGKMMQAMIQRHEELSSSLVSLQEASVFTRFFFFIKNLNIEIFQAALHDFQPGLVLTVEGGVYALAGIAIGVGLYRLMVFVLSITILKIKELVYSQVLIKLR